MIDYSSQILDITWLLSGILSVLIASLFKN